MRSKISGFSVLLAAPYCFADIDESEERAVECGDPAVGASRG